jgi:gamma-glutamyltranspeptidase / glutathione hydrolase
LTGNFEAVTVDAGSGVLRSCADPRRNGAAEAY